MLDARTGLVFLLFSAIAACNCGGATGGQEGDSGTEPDGGLHGRLDGGAGGAPDGGSPKPCSASEPCASPLVCVPSGFCVDDGGCTATADCQTGELCDAGACVPGSACGGQHLAASVVPPNLLITLDRSCSMTQNPDGGKGVSKWSIAGTALTQLLTNLNGQAQFGLTLFPQRSEAGDGGVPCDVPSETVPLGPGNETTIENLLTAASAKTDPNYPSGPCVTPIDSGLHASSLDPALADSSRRSFLILITDGEQTACKLNGGVAGCVSTISALASGTPPVDTFVVGFGSEVNAIQLNEFADAGGEPAAGATAYYQAQDQTSLEAALATISGKTLGCVLKLASVPPNPTLLYVFFDGQKVAQDPTDQNGWNYDSANNEVILYGAACQDVQSGTVTTVDVEFGCTFQ